MKVSPIVVVLLCSLSPALAQSAANACAAAALEDYTRQRVALSQSPDALPIASVEMAIAERRLQEQFCLKYVTCMVGDPSNRSLDLPFRAEFSTCLRREAEEECK
jgi:hypothetical protein